MKSYLINMMNFWQQVLSKIQEDQQAYLLTVIENIGSSPGRKGFKMLIAGDGFICGSIGGGVMEFSLVEEARSLLEKGDMRIFLKRQIHRGHKEHASGMICSGEQTVVFHPLDSKDMEMVQELINCEEENRNGILELGDDSIRFLPDQVIKEFDCEIKSQDVWLFREPVGVVNTLYIIGGGHVSVAVSDLFVSLGFHVEVFDDRQNLNTLESNTSAHKKQVINFHEVQDYVINGSHSYVAIMTNRYVDDKLVLSKLIGAEYAYIGVLGSKAKLKAMWEVLQREGVSKEKLDKVHGPIGLTIKSQTPIEIAVSIAAEVIQLKNKNL